ncbi:MAG TPA: PEP-CTERM sorting domain-containing protein [Syntrophus sp. (in: bacteria)]|nr:PEP-CTERM sorting domain-containing protein [Syntrophus sp. (in: bacteria)]
MGQQRKGTVILGVGLLFVMAIFAVGADAALVQRSAFVGNYGLSTDGFGSTSNSGTISADVPLGATVTAAYLYSATNFSSPTLGTVTLDGTTVVFTDEWTNALGVQTEFFRTGISDVTSIVAPVINGGFGGIYNFSVTESLSATDGEALVVIYRLADATAINTVAILDGPQALTGDSFTANFASPLDPSATGFFAEMRLGDSFSVNGQASTVTVNGTTITVNAGNNDDGAQVADGSLITVGGDNDPFSALNPIYADDHERYNLAPYIAVGAMSITVDTVNPSNDDNIFLAAFFLKGAATIDDGTKVPEPGTLLLLGSGLVGLVGYRRTKRMM